MKKLLKFVKRVAIMLCVLFLIGLTASYINWFSMSSEARLEMSARIELEEQQKSEQKELAEQQKELEKQQKELERKQEEEQKRVESENKADTSVSEVAPIESKGEVEKPVNEPKNDVKIESEPTITDEQQDFIIQQFKDFTEGTALEGSDFRLKVKGDNIDVAVIKPIVEVMSGYNVFTSKETVKAFRSTLVFDVAIEVIKEEIPSIEKYVFYLFDNESNYENNEYYTLKTQSVE